MDLLIFALILVGIIVLIMFLQFINSRRDDRLYLDKLNSQIGSYDRSSYDSERLLYADAYFRRHQVSDSIDDITWSDLSMDEIYMLMDHTESDAGRQILYHILRNPLYDVDSIAARREMLDHWMSNRDLRNRLLLYLHHAGRPLHASVYELTESLHDLEIKPFSGYLVRIALLILTIISMFFIPGPGTVAFVVVLLVNAYAYYRDRARLLPYLHVISHISALIRAAEEMESELKKSDSPILSQNGSELGATTGRLREIKRQSRIILSSENGRNPVYVIMGLVGMLFYADIIRFGRLKELVLDHLDDIDRLIYLTGSIDAYISVAGYLEANMEKLNQAGFTDPDTSVIHITDVCHPLIADAIPNSIEVSRSILLTGANASGKSTFLKSIALSMIFAQTCGYVHASRYEAPIIMLSSAMSVSDDIVSGDSYYMAEIKAVKRMIDRFRTDDHPSRRHVCFVDELLNGTNTEERIAACTQILQSMQNDGVTVFAATHDIELTVLLKESFDNYHFEEDLSDGDVRFSYMLKDGPSKSSNAIRLLVLLGFDDVIVEQAVNMVKRHQKDGIWSRDM